MGQVAAAGKEADERPALPGGVVADGAAQHRKAGLEGIQDGALRHRRSHVELDLSLDPRERAEMGRKHHPDHCSVWTSTDRTGGRSRTMADQLSPPLVEA